VLFVDHPPQALPDSALAVAGRTIIIDPLANDLDPDQDPVYLDGLTSVPSLGSVVVNPDHTISYPPEPGETGWRTIVYELDDGNGGAATADITIPVLAPASVDHAAVRPPARGTRELGRLGNSAGNLTSPRRADSVERAVIARWDGFNDEGGQSCAGTNRQVSTNIATDATK